MKHNFDGIEVDVTHQGIAPEDKWDNRYEEFKKHVKCKEIYLQLEPDERMIIVEQVRKAIERMYRDVEDWIPEAFTVFIPGECIKLEYNLIVLDIEKKLSDVKSATYFKSKETTEEILKDLNET